MANIRISELPLSIQNNIPYSIRTYKDLYSMDELPYNIQELIEEYLTTEKSVSYNIAYDCTPDLSDYGDFSVINNKYDLISEYFKNYLSIPTKGYPFDPAFYSSLKKNLQMKDTTVRYQLISAEIHNIARFLATDLNINITIDNISIEKVSSTGVDAEYNCIIILNINNTKKKVTVSSS